MAKLSSVNKNNRRIKLSEKFFKKRENLKKIVAIHLILFIGKKNLKFAADML